MPRPGVIRVNPVGLVLALLPLIGIGTGFEATLLRHRAEIQAAQSAYAVAVSAAQTQLAMQLVKITGDAALAQNLTWRLAHSVSGALAGRVQKGALDQVTLIDKSCAELGRASFDHPLAVACPFAAGAEGAGEGGFFPVPLGGRMALGLIRPLAGRTDAFAVGVVQLDESWLGLHPELKGRMAALGLALGGDGAPLAQDPGVAAGMPLLTSDRTLDRFLLSRLGREFAGGNPLLWPLLALAFAAAGMALWRERSGAARRRGALADFTLWCQALAPGGELALSGRAQPQVSGDVALALSAAKPLIAQALRLKSDVIQGLSQRRQGLEGQLRAREEELAKQRRRLAELAELDSLAVQLARTTTAFLARMERFRCGVDDLGDVVEAGLAGQGRELHGLLLDWQRGIAERGARKFLRGLSETEGAAGRTRLDEQVETMAALAGGISDQANGALGMVSVLRETAAFAARLAGLWHGLSINPKDDLPCLTLATPVDEAQTLVRLEKRFEALAFSNLLGDGTVPLPALPKPIWVSALYHLYLAMAELGGSSGAGIASRLRLDGDKALFVIQVTGADEALLPKRGEMQAYHMEISRAILAPFHVALVALPSLSGPFPVAMTWSAARPYPTPDGGAERTGGEPSV